MLDLCHDHPAAASSSGSSGGGKEAGASDPRSSTFLVQLSLDPSSPEAAAVSQQSVLLQVAVSYSTSPCFEVQEPPEPPADAAAADAGQQQVAPLLQQEGAQQDKQVQVDAPVQQQQQQQEEVTGVGSSTGQHAAGMPQSPAAAVEAGGTAGVGCGSQQYPLVLHGQPTEQQPAAVGAGQLRQSPQVSPSRAHVHAREGQAPTAAAAAVPVAADAAVPLTAELCVKVVRACGLQVGAAGGQQGV